MLRVQTTIGPSAIHGVGLFAAEPIAAGRLVWEFTPPFDCVWDLSSIDQLGPAALSQLERYSYVDPQTGDRILCSDDARFMNHCESGNIGKRNPDPGSGDRFGASIAARDIEVGEELTCNYLEFDRDALIGLSRSSEHGMPPVRRHSWLSPAIRVGPATTAERGRGLFATRALPVGHTALLWGGAIVTSEEVTSQPRSRWPYAFALEEGLYLCGGNLDGSPEPADHVNHCCDANLGFLGQVAIVVRRPVEAGEEVCIDYATCDPTSLDEFDCLCGAEGCRGRFTADDWRRRDVRDRYQGCFTPYVQRLIDGLHTESNGGRSVPIVGRRLHP